MPNELKKKKKKKKKKGYPTILLFLLGARASGFMPLPRVLMQCGVMVIVVGNGHGDSSSNPGKNDWISHSTNTLGKGVNPIILPPAMGK